LSVLFLKANATRNKRYIAILTDTPVKAAFRDAQKLRQVTKGKRTSEAKQEAPFDNPERDSKKKRKIVRKIQTAQTKMVGKHFVWFPWTHTAIV
jgi:hypothetical protein